MLNVHTGNSNFAAQEPSSAFYILYDRVHYIKYIYSWHWRLKILSLLQVIPFYYSHRQRWRSSASWGLKGQCRDFFFLWYYSIWTAYKQTELMLNIVLISWIDFYNWIFLQLGIVLNLLNVRVHQHPLIGWLFLWIRQGARLWQPSLNRIGLLLYCML